MNILQRGFYMISTIGQAIFSIYALIVFLSTFLLMMPFFVLADVLNKPVWGLKINHFWGKLCFFIMTLPIEVTYKSKLDKSKNYIFCANHFSYLDIAVMVLLSHPIRFVGKKSITKVPLFGYMFKAFHITVDRSKSKQKYASYNQCIDSLNDGYSLGIFPEGGMKSNNPPKMAPLKEGAFRMALETNVAIVPISLIDNWELLPSRKYSLKHRKCRIIVHEPIEPSNYTLDTTEDFQRVVFETIQKDLDHYNN